MRKRVDSGLWEIFAPDVGEGTVYKYEITDRDGRLQPLKADPFGFGSELRPSTASSSRAPTISPGTTTPIARSVPVSMRGAGPMADL